MLTIRSSSTIPEDGVHAELRGGRPPSLASLARELPPVVYFIRTKDGLIKIGFTRDLHGRKRHFDSGWQHILAIIPGDMKLEHEMHVRFSEHLAQGREYFHPAPELMDYINEIRERLGVSPIAA